MCKCSGVGVLSLFVASIIVSAVAQDNSGIPRSSATIIFNRDNVLVNPGDGLNLECGVDGEYRSCIWEKSNGQSLQVADVHDGVYKNIFKPQSTKGNECGIVIKQVHPDDHGFWTCKVFVLANTLEGAKNVIVTVRPQQPILDVDMNPLIVSEGTDTQIRCTVAAARPAARVRWYVGTEDITGHSQMENIPTDDMGTYRTESSLNYAFKFYEDRKIVRCSIEHYTLNEPEYSEIPLDVRYAPHAMSMTKIYGIPMGDEYEIKYNFTANPVPHMVWTVGNTQVPVPGELGRYTADFGSLNGNLFMATLRIRDFTQDDLSLVYKLGAQNDYGEKSFEISLSTGPAPPDTMGGGALAAIIIVVLFIVILLLVICLMRYRQMYCFGQKDRVKDHMKQNLKESKEVIREEHDTESSPEKVNAAKTGSILQNLKSIIIKPRNAQKSDGLATVEEGNVEEEKSKKEKKDKKDKRENKDKKVKSERKSKKEERKDRKKGQNNEVVYAELELGKGEGADLKSTNGDKTEYAEIVGTLPAHE